MQQLASLDNLVILSDMVINSLLTKKQTRVVVVNLEQLLQLQTSKNTQCHFFSCMFLTHILNLNEETLMEVNIIKAFM